MQCSKEDVPVAEWNCSRGVNGMDGALSEMTSVAIARRVSES